MEQFFKDYKEFKDLLTEDALLSNEARREVLVAFVSHYPYPHPRRTPPPGTPGGLHA